MPETLAIERSAPQLKLRLNDAVLASHGPQRQDGTHFVQEANALIVGKSFLHVLFLGEGNWTPKWPATQHSGEWWRRRTVTRIEVIA